MEIEQLDFAVEIIYQRRAGLDPIAAIVVGDRADLPNAGAVNVAAEHRLYRVVLSVTDDGRLELADEIDGVLDPLLRVSAQRPVAQAKPPPHEIDQRIEAEQKLVAKIAGEGEPARVLHHRVQLVAMNDENAPPIGGLVDGLFLDRDVAVVTAELADEIVVVARDVNDARSFARFAQEFLNDVVMLLRPVNSAPHLPDIDEIADNVERLHFVIAKEIEQRPGVAAARAEMHIRNPRRAQASWDGCSDHPDLPKPRVWLERLHGPQK